MPGSGGSQPSSGAATRKASQEASERRRARRNANSMSDVCITRKAAHRACSSVVSGLKICGSIAIVARICPQRARTSADAAKRCGRTSGRAWRLGRSAGAGVIRWQLPTTRQKKSPGFIRGDAVYFVCLAISNSTARGKNRIARNLIIARHLLFSVYHIRPELSRGSGTIAHTAQKQAGTAAINSSQIITAVIAVLLPLRAFPARRRDRPAQRRYIHREGNI